MANFRLLLAAIAYTPTADSADSNFPVTNITDETHLLRCWKALGSGSIVNVTLDFGAGNTFASLAADPGLFIDDVNVTSLRIQGNSVTTDWVTPPWDQVITVAKHEGVARYKYFVRLADLIGTAFGYRYLNLRFPAQSTTDGATYRISRVRLGTVTELTVNPSYDSEATAEQDAIHTEFIGGGSESNIMGEPYFLMAFPRTLSSTAARDQQWVIDAIGKGQPFVVWDASEGGTQDGWLVKRVEAIRVRKEFLAYYKTVWPVREVI